MAKSKHFAAREAQVNSQKVDDGEKSIHFSQLNSLPCLEFYFKHEDYMSQQTSTDAEDSNITMLLGLSLT